MKRRTHLLSLALVTLMAAPAAAQVRHRDHRQSSSSQRYVQSPVIQGYGPSAGAVGTLVTVNGRNFAPGTLVVYDGRLLTPSSVTSRSITFAIPSRSSSGQIALRVPGIRGDVLVGAFTVPTRSHPPPQSYDPIWNLEQDLRNTRSTRRNRSRGLLMSRWDRGFLASPRIQAELALHAERMARLERMQRLASRSRDASLRFRINAAIAAENARHERQMQILRAGFRRG